MPGGTPTAGDVHVNTPLTNISIAYMQNPDGFIAQKAFPVVSSPKQSNLYFVYEKAQWNRADAKPRAPGTETVGGGWRIGQDNFFCLVWGIHKDIDDQIRANQDDPINMDRDATEWVSRQLMLRREIDWQTRYFKTGVWGLDRTGVASAPTGTQFIQWNKTGATPILDVATEQVRIAEATGFKPNKLIITPYVLLALKNNADVIDRIKYTQRGIVTQEMLAGMFDVDEVLVSWGIQTTDPEKETDTAAVHNFIMGKHALLLYAAPSPGLMSPSAGYTFSWTGYLGAGPQGNRIKRFRIEPLAADRVEGEMAFVTKVTGSDLGTFFSGAVS